MPAHDITDHMERKENPFRKLEKLSPTREEQQILAWLATLKEAKYVEAANIVVGATTRRERPNRNLSQRITRTPFRKRRRQCKEKKARRFK